MEKTNKGSLSDDKKELRITFLKSDVNKLKEYAQKKRLSINQFIKLTLSDYVLNVSDGGVLSKN